MPMSREAKYTLREDDKHEFSPSPEDVFDIHGQPLATLHPWSSSFGKFVEQADSSDRTTYRLVYHIGYTQIMEIRSAAHVRTVQEQPDVARGAKAADDTKVKGLFDSRPAAAAAADDEESSEVEEGADAAPDEPKLHIVETSKA